MDNKNELQPNKDINTSVSLVDNKLFIYAEDIIQKYNIPEDKIIDKFRFIISEISAYITPTIDYHNIKSLDLLFNDFIKLCEYYGYIPTIDTFKRLSGVDDYILYCDRFKGRKEASAAEIRALKTWVTRCRAALTETLVNSRGTDANRIFIAKAVYGMAETQPQTAETVQKQGAGDILGGLGIEGGQ